jgi:ribosomal subunit interface protein
MSKSELQEILGEIKIHSPELLQDASVKKLSETEKIENIHLISQVVLSRAGLMNIPSLKYIEIVEKLKKFVAEGELIKVIVGAEKKTFYCEIFWHDKLQAKDYFAKESGDNLYTQIDNAVDKITHQLQRVHDKNIVKHHKKDPLKRMIATN